jgi:hypothetical protein
MGYPQSGRFVYELLANDAEKKAAEEKIRSSMRTSRGNCAS